jgi:hypothetical protein
MKLARDKWAFLTAEMSWRCSTYKLAVRAANYRYYDGTSSSLSAMSLGHDFLYAHSIGLLSPRRSLPHRVMYYKSIGHFLFLADRWSRSLKQIEVVRCWRAALI